MCGIVGTMGFGCKSNSSRIETTAPPPVDLNLMNNTFKQLDSIKHAPPGKIEQQKGLWMIRLRAREQYVKTHPGTKVDTN